MNITSPQKVIYSTAELIKSNHKIEEIQSLWLYLYVEIDSILRTNTKFVIEADILEEPEFFSYFGDAVKRYNKLYKLIK